MNRCLRFGWKKCDLTRLWSNALCLRHFYVKFWYLKRNLVFFWFLNQTHQKDEVSKQFGRKIVKNVKTPHKTSCSYLASIYVGIWSKTWFFERPALTRAHPRSPALRNYTWPRSPALTRAHPRSLKEAFLRKCVFWNIILAQTVATDAFVAFCLAQGEFRRRYQFILHFHIQIVQCGRIFLLILIFVCFLKD